MGGHQSKRLRHAEGVTAPCQSPLVPVQCPPSPARRGREAQGLHVVGTSAGADLLSRLRGNIEQRPIVDPGLAGGLREWLEDGASEALRSAGEPGERVVVGRWSQREYVDPLGVREVTSPYVRAALVGALFRQVVTSGRIDNPMDDAMSALAVDGRGARISEFMVRLGAAERAKLIGEVVDHAEVLVATWPALPPAWLPRTSERRSVPLAGGHILLSGLVDLALGAPARNRASVCLVDVRSGERRTEHSPELHFLGLLETVSAGAPPFRLATYYTSTGELDVEDVDDQLLAVAAENAVDAVHRAVSNSTAGPTAAAA